MDGFAIWAWESILQVWRDPEAVRMRRPLIFPEGDSRGRS